MRALAEDDQAGDGLVRHLLERSGPGEVGQVYPEQDQPVQVGPHLGGQVGRIVGGEGCSGVLAARDGGGQRLEGRGAPPLGRPGSAGGAWWLNMNRYGPGLSMANWQ